MKPPVFGGSSSKECTPGNAVGMQLREKIQEGDKTRYRSSLPDTGGTVVAVSSHSSGERRQTP